LAVLSLFVSAGFIWYAVKGVDFARVGQLLRQADYLWVLPTIVVGVVNQYVRVWRLRFLVSPIAQMKMRELFRIGNISMMAVLILPWRLGEFVRPYLMKREYGVSMSASLAPSAAERVIDGLVVTLGFFALTQSGVSVPTDMRYYGFVALLVFLGAAAVLAIVLVGHEAGANLLRRMIALVSPKLADRVVGMATAFAHGLTALKRPSDLSAYMLWTVIYWILGGLSNWTLFRTMHLDLPVLAGYVITAATVISLMMPAGPGFVGPFQAAVVLALAFFGVEKEMSLAYSIVLHVLIMAVTIAFGVWSLLRAHLSMSTLVKESQEQAAT
jgi:uncharacterized protein (TIRG00374 family)